MENADFYLVSLLFLCHLEELLLVPRARSHERVEIDGALADLGFESENQIIG